MADTSIEWTDKVWNPVTGCSKVSQGCKNCYAETIADRFFAKQYPPNADGSDVRCHEDRLGNKHFEGISDAPIRVGKKAAGRLLDSREWNQYPELRAEERR